jgi:cysteine desulfurase
MQIMTERAYLDWNATAPLRPEARAAMVAALDTAGNPSSVHAEGRAARRLIEEAREQVAALVGALPKNVTFTSGGTEANVLALAPGEHLLVSAIEHPSVRAGGRFAAVEEIAVTGQGQVDLAALERRLAEVERPLVSIMAANNETGIIQPIAAAAAIVHAADGLLHTDAVQAAGKIVCNIETLGADFLSVSAHKLGGPKGVGALIRRDDRPIEPLIKGGGQERGARAGTENVAAIAGFGAAAAAAADALEAQGRRMAALRDRLEAEIKVISPDAIIFGADVARLPNTTLFTVPGLKAETAVIALDLDGVAVSSGAACSSGKVAPSHVLAAMGVGPALARGAVRVSVGWSTNEADIDRFLTAWRNVSGALLKESRGVAA